VIPISQVVLPDRTEELVLSVLRSGQLAQGPMVAAFEQRFAELTGVAHAVAVSNGTVALVAALRALGLRRGDEVVTSPFTFVATLNAILEVGATACFADIDPVDFNLDAAKASGAITERTKAVMPVHLYGQCADLDAFVRLADEQGLGLVEDAAQAHGATAGGRTAGSAGLGCFSFYATKNLTTGEGGMVTTDDERLADKLRVLRNQGMRARYQYELVGGNHRMTDLQAAVGLPQLDAYAEAVAARRAHAAALSEGLAGLDGLLTPSELPGRDHVWHQYTVRVTEDAPVDRDRLAQHLQSAGVGCGVYYPRIVFDYECFRDHPSVRATEVPEASRAAHQVLSLPVHPALSARDLDRIVETVRDAFNGARR
jgi:dTDP-4-amino-4,6-dideoxygalactose transaminase